MLWANEPICARALEDALPPPPPHQLILSPRSISLHVIFNAHTLAYVHTSLMSVNCPARERERERGINACVCARPTPGERERKTEKRTLRWWRWNAASANLTHNCNFQKGILLNARSYKYPFCILVCSHHYASAVRGMSDVSAATFITRIYWSCNLFRAGGRRVKTRKFLISIQLCAKS